MSEKKNLEIAQEDARLLPYKKHKTEILKQNIRRKMRKKYERKVQTHSKSHRRMQKKRKL